MPFCSSAAISGGGTGWSSLRIIHGGLRYLKSLDLRRFRESVAERRWFNLLVTGQAPGG